VCSSDLEPLGNALVASARTPRLTANSKSPAHEPDRERNASRAGRESSTGRAMMPTSLALDGRACGLRTGAPAAKPLVTSLTGRKLKALIPSLCRTPLQPTNL